MDPDPSSDPSSGPSSESSLRTQKVEKKYLYFFPVIVIINFVTSGKLRNVLKPISRNIIRTSGEPSSKYSESELEVEKKYSLFSSVIVIINFVISGPNGHQDRDRVEDY